MAKKKKPKRREPEPAATAQPLIFLDIDGVLAPFGGRAPPGPPTQRSAKLDADAFAPFDERCTQRLAAIVAATGATIVLSSSWRARADAVAVVERRFRAFGLPLSEKVPLPTTDINYHSVRQWEIARYLEKRPARRWVALDDEELVGGEECAERRALFVDRVSTIDSTAGLQDVHVDEAIRVLCEQ